MPVDFLILDQQSTEDRKVIVIQKDAIWVKPDGAEAHDPYGADATQWTI